MKLFIAFFMFLSVMSKAECPRLDGAVDLPPEITTLLPSDQLVCAQKFYRYQTSGEETAHFCSCFDRENPMDQVAASTATSAEEDKQLKNLIEDMVVEHAKASVDTFFSNALYFDAYVRRGALDTRFLANMDQCRLRGFVEKLKNPPNPCNQATYARRLAKFFYSGSGAPDSAFESMVKKALTSEEGKEKLFGDYIKSFQKSTIPLAKNIIPEHSPNACMPFKAYMMFASPPIDDELFDDTLSTGGLDYDRKGKEHLLQNFLHLPEMGASFLSKVEHPQGFMLQANPGLLEYKSRNAGNNPLMLLVFQHEPLLTKFKNHIAQSGQCDSDQYARYRQAIDIEYQRYRDEKMAELTPLCATETGKAYRTCLSDKKWMAKEYADSKLPRQEEWAKQQNEKQTGSEPICETEKDFFQKQENINEIIKAQNTKCENFRANIGPEFLCKEDISNFKPATLELELGPKIFKAFGSDDGPRIFNRYMKQHYCSVTSEGKGVPKRIVPSPLEDFGIIDHLRPKSELTDVRNGKESSYVRYNKFLCSKMNGRRPDGSTFSCANNSARPPECNQSIYFKQMACQALKSELDGVTPVLSEERKRDYFLTPEEHGDSQHNEDFPSSRESPDQGPMILEFQRLANTLPGDLGANCALPNPLPSESATVSSWFASEERRVAQGSGSGSGSGSSSSPGDSGAAFFSDYFLEGTPTDETHLADFRTANPGITNGVIDPSTPLIAPYERRVTVEPPTSLVGPRQPTPVPIAAVVPDTPTDPTLAKLPGSFAERGMTYRAPASIAPPVVAKTTDGPGPVITPTPVAIPTTVPSTNDSEERIRRMQERLAELDRKEAELREANRLTELERMSQERERLQRELDALRNGNNVAKVTPTPTPGPIPIPTATQTVGGGNEVNQGAGGGSQPLPGRGKISSRGPQGFGAGGGSSSGRVPASMASRSGGNGQSASLDGFAQKYAKNSRFRAPIEPYEGKPGGLPGIKALKHHLSYESPWILPLELIELFGIKKVVMYFHLEGKTFSALKVLGPNEYQIIVYAFNPRDLSKTEIETKVEIDRRMRVKRLLEEMRATPEEAEKNARSFSTAADNTHELARELLLTERDRKMALDQMLSEAILNKAWEELRHFVVPPAEPEE